MLYYFLRRVETSFVALNQRIEGLPLVEIFVAEIVYFEGEASDWTELIWICRARVANDEVFTAALVKELLVAGLVATWALVAIVAAHWPLHFFEGKLTLLTTVTNTIESVKDHGC